MTGHESEGGANEAADARDYDVDHYVRALRESFASRLARAFTPADFEAIFADPEQPSLFPLSPRTMHTCLTSHYRSPE
jgi:hypothetical protein